MRDRLLGALLFLPVPLVLILFTRAPLGIGWSLLLGIAIMGTHRLYARPFALARAGKRCLWCGRTLPAPPAGADPDAPPTSAELVVDEPSDTTRWRTCLGAHEERARRFLGRAGAQPLLVATGILLPLVVFLATAGLVAAHYPWPVTFADTVDAFRLAIGCTVLPLAIAADLDRSPLPADPMAVPFPVHMQALIGTGTVLWLFRIVGAVWILLALAHFGPRIAHLASGF